MSETNTTISRAFVLLAFKAYLMSSNDLHKLAISMIPAGDRGVCKNGVMSWKKFRDMILRVQVDQTMKHTEYLSLSVDGKNKAKDVGSYVLGHFKNQIRKKENIETRSGVALDIDHPTEAHISWLENGLSDVCNFEFLAVTTRSHTITKQKWRLIFPTKKLIPAEQFSAVSRILSSMLFQSIEESMEAVDDVSHRVAQIMYKSSRSRDGVFDSFHNEGSLLDHEALLAGYDGWEDWTRLPYAPSRGNARPGGSTPAEVPWEKGGIVGAFCRTYPIEEAMRRFLPGVYVKPTKGSGGTTRWTYAKGSGSNGAIVYPDGHLYSNHGTDPCSDRNVNAFDLVRLHKFGDLDKRDDGEGGSPAKQPSFKAMRDLITKDGRVQAALRQIEDERRDAMFESLDAPGEVTDDLDDATPAVRTGDTFLDDPEPETPPRFLNGHAYLNNLTDDALAMLGEDVTAEAVDDGLDPFLGTPKVESEDLTGNVPAYVKYFNNKCSIVLNKGKVMIAYDRTDGIELGSMDDFTKFYRYKHELKDNGTKLYFAQEWIDHPQHKMYEDGIVFHPLYKGERALNMWRGFSVEPNPKASCELFLRHIKEVICNGVEIYADYLIKYLAHMVQHPEDKPGVALIFRGKKGSGKDTFGEYVGRMIASHYTVVYNSEQFFGKHNAQMQYALLLHLEEAIWVGDRGNDSKLKAMITTPRAVIEPKFVNAFEVDSFVRILMTSNAEWVVPASFDERRYFVQDVSDRYMRDPSYFDPLRAEMNSDGPAGLLAYLKGLDIRTFNVRKVPDTEALQDQKEHGLTDVNLWWFESLKRGELPGSEDLEEHPKWETETVEWPSNRCFGSYFRWVEKRPRDRYSAAEMTAFGKRFSKLFEGGMGVKKKRTKETKSGFMQVYRLPNLAECRRQFTKITGIGFGEMEEIESSEIRDGFDLLEV